MELPMMKSPLMLILILFCAILPAEEITVDRGKIIGFSLSVPEKSNSNGKLCVVMPGGPMAREMANEMKGWSDQFAKNGYHSAVLYTDFGPLINFSSQQNNKYIDSVIDALKAKCKITEEKVLLAGRSNGGTASFQYAQRNPTKTYGIIAAPGGYAGGKLTNIPVLFYIGGNDQLGWAKDYDRDVKAIRASGATLTTELLKGKPHIFDLNWNNVEAWLKTLR
jgi:predicted esterase